MSAIILYQQGENCLDPKTNSYYDPWSSHIYDCIKQVREWNKEIDFYLILDSTIEPDTEFIKKYKVNIINSEELILDRDISFLSDYYLLDRNPLWRSSFIRFFYIEQLIKNKNLKNVFTFDNDVLIFSDLSSISTKFQYLYKQCAITRISDDGIVCGMLWISNYSAMQKLNNAIIELYSMPNNSRLTETSLLHQVNTNFGEDLLSSLPIWYDGQYSKNFQIFEGFFDPGTFGQFLGGCHNGSPRGHIMMHHLLGPEIKKYTEDISMNFMGKTDDDGRYYYYFKSNDKSAEIKLHSLHVHSKNLKEFMRLK
jgi:hypothetical protein